MSQEKAQPTTAHKMGYLNDLHVELGHPSEVITHTTAKSIGIKSLVPLSHEKIRPWEMPKRVEYAKRLLPILKFLVRGYSSTLVYLLLPSLEIRISSLS